MPEISSNRPLDLCDTIPIRAEEEDRTAKEKQIIANS